MLEEGKERKKTKLTSRHLRRREKKRRGGRARTDFLTPLPSGPSFRGYSRQRGERSADPSSSSSPAENREKKREKKGRERRGYEDTNTRLLPGASGFQEEKKKKRTI